MRGGKVVYLDYSGCYMNLHVIKLHGTTHTHITAHKTGTMLMRTMDYTSVIFLVLIFYYNYMKCFHRGVWVRGIQGLYKNVV